MAEIRDGDYAYWKYYDFDQAEVKRFICKTWDNNRAAKIELRLDSPEGELIGVCELEPMQGETAYVLHEASVKSVKGKHALVMVFRGDPLAKEEDIMNLEWFTFTE